MKCKINMKQIKRFGMYSLSLSLLATIMNISYPEDIHAQDDSNSIGVRNTIYEGVDLEDRFNLSGVASNYEGTLSKIIDGDSSFYKLENGVSGKNKNKVVIGKSDPVYVRQSIALTSNYAIDFKRKFKLVAKVNLSSVPDGFAIAFHTNGNYKNRNSGGSLGVYSNPSNEIGKNAGVPNGIVFEADTFNNLSPHYNDTFVDGGSRDLNHFSINLTDSRGVVDKNYSSGQWKLEDKFLNKDVYFSIDWNPETNLFEVNFGGGLMSLEIKDSQKLSILKNSQVFYTLSSVLYLGEHDVVSPNPNAKNIIELDSFKYTDLDPIITTQVDIVSNNTNKTYPYLVAGDKVVITHKIQNNVNVNNTFDDYLHFGNFSQAGLSYDPKNITDIYVGIAGPDNYHKYPVQKFDSKNPIKVKLLANKAAYYVQYSVHIPDLKRFAEPDDKLIYHVQLGTKGMSMINNSGEIKIKNPPRLYSFHTKENFLDEGEKELYDAMRADPLSFESANELASSFWFSIFAQSSKKGQPFKLSEEIATQGNYQVNWEYSKESNKNFHLLGQNNKLKNLINNDVKLEKSEIYSIKIEVMDKSDVRLKNSFYRYIVVADTAGPIYKTPDNKNLSYVFGSKLSPITETELVNYDKDGFINYVKNSSKPIGLKFIASNPIPQVVKEHEFIVNTDGWINSKNHSIKKPGKDNNYHNISLFFRQGQSEITINVLQEVLPNVLGHYKFNDDGSIKEEDIKANGVNGFIAIPSTINLKNGKGDKIVGSTEVLFLDYQTGNETQFDFSMDKSFVIRNSKDNSNITIESNSRNAIDLNNGKLKIGRLNSTNNRALIEFSGSNANTLGVKGRWDGQVRFYFDRIQ